MNTLRTRALANGQVATVMLTFRADYIAQEPNETFILTLDPVVAPNPREGLFFQNAIEVTIVNDDCNKQRHPLYNNLKFNFIII